MGGNAVVEEISDVGIVTGGDVAADGISHCRWHGIPLALPMRYRWQLAAAGLVFALVGHQSVSAHAIRRQPSSHQVKAFVPWCVAQKIFVLCFLRQTEKPRNTLLADGAADDLTIITSFIASASCKLPK